MKFEIGDDTDKKLIKVLFHEFVMCEEAFDSFLEVAAVNIMGNRDSQIKRNSYKLYSEFLSRFYEFYVGCFKREFRDTANIGHEKLDALFNSEAEKMMRNRRYAIESGKAPSWENHISYYQESVPEDFGRNFRGIRNNASHADFRRAGGDRMSLLEFNEKYHKYVHMLYYSALFAWSGKTHKDFQIEHVEEFDFSSNGN